MLTQWIVAVTLILKKKKDEIICRINHGKVWFWGVLGLFGNKGISS